MSVKNHSISAIKSAFDLKRSFFDQGFTKTYDFRRRSLLALKSGIIKYEGDILAALKSDFQKPSYEAYIGEIGVTTDDINHALKHLRSWMEVQHVGTPITIQPASSKIYSDPLGVVLIFSPWNYPFNLMMIPLIGAIAAGNCVILKPAHETANTAIVIEKIISEIFDPQHVSVVMGEGKAMGELLLDNFHFNHIFFTGSPGVGKWIMEKAAKTLTPVTLELGGKSPTIVDKTANLKVALNRIVWAKYFNCGQTCTSPDYILVHKDIKEAFLRGVVDKIKEFYGDDPQKSPYYPRMVNDARFKAVSNYLSQGGLVSGGRTDASERYIEPTVLDIQDLNVPIMQQEIFGPVMPVIEWSNKEELIEIIRKNRYPLTCYIFSEDKGLVDFIIERVEFGSGCINDTMAQFANPNFPFGGVQTSGIGKYHGKYSFDTFSNLKPILKTSTFIDPDLRYPPYTSFKMKLARWFLE
ncbi:MAG: aldehyde dehydrogenase family protein [Saprospiraceae bacterium]|nr:aldehyde dehydrogenase family protein [Saprospiraceae bacterium]